MACSLAMPGITYTHCVALCYGVPSWLLADTKCLRKSLLARVSQMIFARRTINKARKVLHSPWYCQFINAVIVKWPTAMPGAGRPATLVSRLTCIAGFRILDKPLVHQALASEIAEIHLKIPKTSFLLAFLRGFWEALVRE